MNVLILPDSATAEAVAEQLVGWSAAQLLEPFCLWTAGAGDDAVVDVVGAGGRERLVLADALAREDPRRTSFIAFHPVVGGAAVPASFAEQVERMLAHARVVLDFDPDRALTCLLAVAPESEDERIDPDVFRGGWGGLYVVPEDRAQPHAANRLPAGGDRFVRHAAHAAATLGELWATPAANRPGVLAYMRDLPAGPLLVAVRAVRCFSRVVELGYVADHVAATAFARRDGWPRPDVDRFERVKDPAPVIAHLVRGYLYKHRVTLRGHSYRPIGDPPGRLTLLEALRRLIGLLLGQARRYPRERAQQAVAHAYDEIVDRVNGLLDTRVHARVPRWGEVPPDEREAPQLAERVAGPLLPRDGAVSAAWRDLRTLTIGLVDGADLPDGIGAEELHRGDRRVVVCDPGLLVRDPDVPLPKDASDTTLVGRVRSAVATAAARAKARAEALERPAREPDAPPAPPWWRGPLATLTVFLLAYTTLAAAAGIEAWQRLDPLARPLALVGLAALWGLAALDAVRRAFMRLGAADDERMARELRELNRELERILARADAARLERRCAELDDWAAILGELLHRPWVREPFGSVALGEVVRCDTLPDALAVGVADLDRRQLERIGSQARAQAFHTGWLSEVYRAVSERTMAEWAAAHGARRPIDPAGDLSEAGESPRTALLDRVRRGDGRRLWESPLTAELLEAIDAVLLDELAPAVLAHDGQAQPLGPTTTWMGPPSGVHAVAQRARRHVVGVGVNAGVLLAADVVLTASAAVPRGMGVVVTMPDGDTTLVTDVHRPAHTGLALLRLPSAAPADDAAAAADEAQGETGGDATPEGEEAASDGDGAAGAGPAREPAQLAPSEPAAGDPFVALAPDEEGFTARWGFFAGVGDQPTVAWDGDPPVPGTPLFDLSGRLLALHGLPSRAHRAATLTTLAAMPAEEWPAGLAAGRRRDEAAQQPLAASVFLGAIANGNGARALSPAYWATRADANAVEHALPPELALADGQARIDRLTGGATFLHPLRVMVHTVELTAPAAPTELAACR